MVALGDRQQRKKEAEIKRRTIRIEIHKIIRDALTSGKSFEYSLKPADRYINRKIDARPQDKELILSAAYEVKNMLEKYLREASNATK